MAKQTDNELESGQSGHGIYLRDAQGARGGKIYSHPLGGGLAHVNNVWIERKHGMVELTVFAPEMVGIKEDSQGRTRHYDIEALAKPIADALDAKSLTAIRVNAPRQYAEEIGRHGKVGDTLTFHVLEQGRAPEIGRVLGALESHGLVSPELATLGRQALPDFVKQKEEAARSGGRGF